MKPKPLRTVLDFVGVSKAGEVSNLERASKLCAAVSLSAFEKTAEATDPDAVLVDGVPTACIEGIADSAEGLPDWREGSQWDLSIVQLVAWTHLQNVLAKENDAGLVYLGTPQEIASAITGEPCTTKAASSKQRRLIAASVERLTSIRLADIGWVENGGAPALAPAHLMTLEAKASDGSVIVRAGVPLSPHAMADLRDMVRANGSRRLAEEMRGATWYVPVQSRGFSLAGDYLPGSSNRSNAAQNRAYTLLQSYVSNDWTRSSLPGVLLRTKQVREKVCSRARFDPARWGDFIDHLVKRGDYIKIGGRGMGRRYVPTCARMLEELAGAREALGQKMTRSAIAADKREEKAREDARRAAEREKATANPSEPEKPAEGRIKLSTSPQGDTFGRIVPEGTPGASPILLADGSRVLIVREFEPPS